MSWSVNATGTDGHTTVIDLNAKLIDTPYCPKEMREAIVRAAAVMSVAMDQPVKTASSSGHIGDDGKGYASVSINTN